MPSNKSSRGTWPPGRPPPYTPLSLFYPSTLKFIQRKIPVHKERRERGTLSSRLVPRALHDDTHSGASKGFQLWGSTQIGSREAPNF